MEIALEDLTVDSMGVSKVRTLLADVQVRSLHGVPLAELMNLRPGPILRNLEAICEDGGTRNSLCCKAKGRSAGANRVIINVGDSRQLYIQQP